jgi:D-xylose transport system permease protein
MSQPITETPADRPPTNADVTPQAAESLFGRIGFTTTALRAYTMLFALIAIWIYFNYETGGVFLSARNLSTLMVQTAVTGVLATGMLMVIVAGQIDLSVGSVVGLTGMIAAATMTWQGYGLAPAIAATIIAGIVIGLVQGALVAYANIPAFIVTLGGLLAWRGVVKGLSEGTTVPVALTSFKSIGNDFLDPRLGIALAVLAVALIIFFGVRRALAARGEGGGATGNSTARTIARILIPSVLIAVFVFVLNRYQGIPVPVVVLLAVALAGAFLTSRTTFGRYLYAIGGNPMRRGFRESTCAVTFSRSSL